MAATLWWVCVTTSHNKSSYFSGCLSSFKSSRLHNKKPTWSKCVARLSLFIKILQIHFHVGGSINSRNQLKPTIYVTSCETHGKMIKTPAFVSNRQAVFIFSLLWVSHSTNKQWHVGMVTPQQDDKRLQSRERGVRAREGNGGGSPGFNPLLSQRKEGSVSGIIQDQPLF